MYQVGEKLIYGLQGVCRVVGQEERSVDRTTRLFLVLEPLAQPGTKYYVPVHNPAAMAKLRPLLTRQELDALLCSKEAGQDAWIPDESQRKQTYREWIASGDRLALIRLVGALLRHKQDQLAAGRKFHLSDENFLRDAERLLSAEFSQVLGIEPGQVGSYVLSKLEGK